MSVKTESSPEKRTSSESQNPLWRQILLPLAITIFSGLLLLFIEHRSSLFVSTTPTPIVPRDLSPRELIVWYRNQNTQMQADELAKNLYRDKLVQWTGTIKDVVGNEDDTAVVVLDVDGIDVNAKFGNKTKVSALIKGKNLVVICGIVQIHLNSIDINNCEMLTAAYTIGNPASAITVLTPTPIKLLDVLPEDLVA